MKFQSLVLILLVLLASTTRNQAIPGGYSPIKNINDPHVIEIANFAVTEHNKQTGSKLKFEKVIKGESQVVAGTNYRLTISANIGSISKNYEAVVYEALYNRYKKLTSFGPVHA